MLPNKLQHGDSIARLFDLWNQLIDYLQATRLVAGHGIRINKHPAGTTIESTATATGSGAIPPDQWNISAIESEDHIDVSVSVRRAEDNNCTLMFRGKPYPVDNKTFRITRADLESKSIFLVIVKRITAKKIDFTLAMTRQPSYDNTNFRTGIYSLGAVYLYNGTVATSINSNSMIEWQDAYFGNGLFTADLGYTDIPEGTSSFTDFLDTAKQVLAVSQRFPICVNDKIINRTGSGDADVIYTLFDLSSEQISDKAQWLCWQADYGMYYSTYGPINYRFELKEYHSIYEPPAGFGFIRFPVAFISDGERPPWKIRKILNSEYVPTNFPMLYLNPYGKDFAPGGSGALYLDLTAQKLKCSITCFINGISTGSPISLAAPFNVFTYEGELTVRIRFNYSSKQWSKPWFTFGGRALTPEPDFSGTLYEKRIAYITYNSETQRPVIRAQNFSPIIDFTSEREYFTDFQTRITALEARVPETRIYSIESRIAALEARVTNLENA